MQKDVLVTSNPPLSIKDHIEISTLQVIKEQGLLSQVAGSAKHYEIIYLQQGSGNLTVNRNRNDLDIAHVYMISPGQVRMIELDEKATGFYLSVSQDLFGASDSQLTFVNMLQQCKVFGNPMIMQIDLSGCCEIEEIFQKMVREMNTEHYLQLEMLQVFFRTFLLYLSKVNVIAREINVRSHEVQIVKTFMQLVNIHYIKKKMVTEYADELCVTRSYLNKVVKKVSGFTASQIIQQCIIQEAKKQAITSGVSMKQIAYSLGFDDSAHFSKFFKSNSGMNFTNFKKELDAFQLVN
ncbi:helix-turn-helix domain-containing protein [Chitinophaga filiformis]|uniref:helix-turn-helix domain-containing protein n=1 Tax=Chitinophaga filiformis TaxID=104663 RepID=UPI001F43D3CD|nr:helix-turn-helix domain-containing protein [Chitinophaga filiformis]MCF6404592.1 helix-turn-helix domain-containing protein [Chitinophaga filiformis]